MMTNNDNRTRLAFWLLLVALAILFIPWLGLAPFNTKGEPREAIVAVSMLQSGNWILPVSFGADIPYKPPFLAWCIALLSLPAGHVTEFTSRLPSAIAVICLAMMTFAFFRRTTRSLSTAVLTTLVTVTAVEVWRAGFACRVDMVLTACMVGALYALWRWRESGFRGVPFAAVVLMTCAVLTKGPVGMLLPCLVVGIYGLLLGDRFWGLFGRMAAVGLAALVVPALWYVAAYQLGGKEFYDLAMEENFGRMTGTMSYSSHEAPFWYNFVTVAAGMLPYTLLALLSLLAVSWRRVSVHPRRFVSWLRGIPAADAFAFVAVAVIFLFYCFPKSKRSVYLLPIYPFLAYYVVMLTRWLIGRRPNLVRAYTAVIAMVALLASAAVLVFAAMPAGAVPAKLQCLMPDAIGIVAATVSLLAAIYLSWTLWMRRTDWCACAALGVTMLTLVTVSAAILPGILTAKSDRDAAADIAAIVPSGEPVYSYIDFPMLRYYTINFYLDDRVRLYEKELPAEGWMIVSKEDLEGWNRHYGGVYSLTTVYEMSHKSCDRRQPALLVRFAPAAQ